MSGRQNGNLFFYFPDASEKLKEQAKAVHENLKDREALDENLRLRNEDHPERGVVDFFEELEEAQQKARRAQAREAAATKRSEETKADQEDLPADPKPAAPRRSPNSRIVCAEPAAERSGSSLRPADSVPGETMTLVRVAAMLKTVALRLSDSLSGERDAGSHSSDAKGKVGGKTKSPAKGVFKHCFPQKADEVAEPNLVQKIAHMLGMNKFAAYIIMDASWAGERVKTMVRTPKAYDMAYEDVRFPAMDGCQLAAWYIPAKDKASKKLAIVGHQSWACANKSGCETHYRHGWVKVEGIDYVKLHKVLHDAGFHVVAYDLRNHGESESKLPSGFGEVEFMDAMGVMDWVNGHSVLKDCKVALLPFCVSGVAFMKANSLYPKKFSQVVAWATTNIFHGPTIMANRPYMFGMGNVQLLNEALKKKQAQYVKSGELTNPDIKFTAQRISAKPYAPDVKVPILYCDVMHDFADYHEMSCPDIFKEFGKDLREELRQRNELHFLGPNQPAPFTTEGRNRSEGYNFYQSDAGSKVLLGFLSKYCP
ncbi:unnamed protein product [Symbiodinium sp. CCMP2592]|nr:unnamed protein product [Symbiodinium sp. CCMP2592]